MGSLQIQENDGIVLVYMADAKILDEPQIQKIGEELLSAAERAAGTKKMVVNFRGVGYMSSAMIGKLVLLNKHCKNQGITLKLCEISSNVEEVFKIMKLNKVFDIHKTEEKAIKSFDKKGWFG